MEFNELLKKRRTIRRFKQVQVFDKDIRYMLEAARVVACGANIQKLRYIVARDKQLVKDIFDNTAWAGMVSPNRNPEWGKKRPFDLYRYHCSERCRRHYADKCRRCDSEHGICGRGCRPGYLLDRRL